MSSSAYGSNNNARSGHSATGGGGAGIGGDKLNQKRPTSGTGTGNNDGSITMAQLFDAMPTTINWSHAVAEEEMAMAAKAKARSNYNKINDGTSAVAAASTVVVERKRLELMPRTKPIPTGNGAGGGLPAANRSVSIFGAAKPVDTAAKEREIEERLQREKQARMPPQPEHRPQTSTGAPPTPPVYTDDYIAPLPTHDDYIAPPTAYAGPSSRVMPQPIRIFTRGGGGRGRDVVDNRYSIERSESELSSRGMAAYRGSAPPPPAFYHQSSVERSESEISMRGLGRQQHYGGVRSDRGGYGGRHRRGGGGGGGGAPHYNEHDNRDFVASGRYRDRVEPSEMQAPLPNRGGGYSRRGQPRRTVDMQAPLSDREYDRRGGGGGGGNGHYRENVSRRGGGRSDRPPPMHHRSTESDLPNRGGARRRGGGPRSRENSESEFTNRTQHHGGGNKSVHNRRHDNAKDRPPRMRQVSAGSGAQNSTERYNQQQQAPPSASDSATTADNRRSHHSQPKELPKFIDEKPVSFSDVNKFAALEQQDDVDDTRT